MHRKYGDIKILHIFEIYKSEYAPDIWLWSKKCIFKMNIMAPINKTLHFMWIMRAMQWVGNKKPYKLFGKDWQQQYISMEQPSMPYDTKM